MSNYENHNDTVAKKGLELYRDLVSQEPGALHSVPMLTSDELNPFMTFGDFSLVKQGDNINHATFKSSNMEHFIFLNSCSHDFFVDGDMKKIVSLSTIVAMCYLMNHPGCTVRFDMDEDAMQNLRYLGATSLPSTLGVPVSGGSEIPAPDSQPTHRIIRNH
tara:strand:+ start:3884 stop:4366 length:483 start_codon:yes stop_codon:yes gene_type:complete